MVILISRNKNTALKIAGDVYFDIKSFVFDSVSKDHFLYKFKNLGLSLFPISENR